MSYIVDNSYKTKPGLTKAEKEVIAAFDEQLVKIDQMNSISEKEAAVGRFVDTFTNLSARLGFGSNSQSEGAGYVLTRFTFDYQQTTALYRNSWIIQKGINIPAVDMHKLGVQLDTELEPDQVKKVEKKLRQVKQRMIAGTKWGRLYGGAVGVLLIDEVFNKTVVGKDGQEVPLIELPLEIDDINVDAFKGIYVLDRWNGVSPSGLLEDDMTSYHYGKPKYYTINLPDQASIKVHHSWVLEFSGIELPRLERYADAYWGMSELEAVIREVQKRDNTNYSVANLVFQASLRVFKFEGFKQMLASSNEKFQEEMSHRMEALVANQSNQRATVIDSKDDFAVHSTQFSGLDSILETFMEDIAGAFRIPMDKLWGRPGKGFSGDDKASQRNYNEYIENQQEEHLRHNYKKLIDVICKSELGFIPEDIDFIFVSLYTSDQETRRSEFEQKSMQILQHYQAGGIPQSVYLKEMKQLGVEYNMFTNITDEMILQAEEDEKLDLGEEDSEEFMMEDNPELKAKDGVLRRLFKRK